MSETRVIIIIATDTRIDRLMIPPGVWIDVRIEPRAESCPALFLDRDGVIAVDTGFLSDPELAELVPQSAELIAAANRSAIPVAVVTNQSGIDRGLYGWSEFAAVQSRLELLLGVEGAAIDALAACPFHPDFTPQYGAQHARWRKPGPAMLTALAERMGTDIGKSWLVGDRMRDIEAARAAGLAGAVLLGKDEAKPAAEVRPGADSFQMLVAANPADALSVLKQRSVIGGTR